MATVTVTFTDTPVPGVSAHISWMPGVGIKPTPAQSAALDAYNRANREWGCTKQIGDGVDIDRVHRQRDNVVNPSL